METGDCSLRDKVLLRAGALTDLHTTKYDDGEQDECKTMLASWRCCAATNPTHWSTGVSTAEHTTQHSNTADPQARINAQMTKNVHCDSLAAASRSLRPSNRVQPGRLQLSACWQMHGRAMRSAKQGQGSSHNFVPQTWWHRIMISMAVSSAVLLMDAASSLGL
jgi:hypothetical protein